MKETDNVRMEINIGGEHLKLSVPFREQNAVRDTERKVAELYESWSRRFPGRPPHEILAMVTYRFAYQYCSLEQEMARATMLAEETARSLDHLIEGIGMPEVSESQSETTSGDFPHDGGAGLYTEY